MYWFVFAWFVFFRINFRIYFKLMIILLSHSHHLFKRCKLMRFLWVWRWLYLWFIIFWTVIHWRYSFIRVHLLLGLVYFRIRILVRLIWVDTALISSTISPLITSTVSLSPMRESTLPTIGETSLIWPLPLIHIICHLFCNFLFDIK